MGFEHGSLRPKATELTTRPPPRPRGQSRHRLTSSWVKICGSSLISLSAIINDLQLGVIQTYRRNHLEAVHVVDGASHQTEADIDD